ncbi:hypothetical protein GGE24_004705 [Bradyrhizobium centrosematis]|nr:hypothetical protein [Bradyrhizobium centrosematis]MCS3775366.1 hypothetical protein [Bradyrhizobium centrosematis]
MRFLYRRHSPHLENLCPRWHFSTVESPGSHRANIFHLLRAAVGPPRKVASAWGATRSNPMMDILMLALGFGFFALAIGYTYACERL